MKMTIIFTIIFTLFLIPCLAQGQNAEMSNSAKELAEQIRVGNNQSILDAGTLGDKTVVTYLKSVIAKNNIENTTSTKIKIYAQMALAKLGEKQYFDEIAAEVNNPNPDVQDKAIDKLGYIANDEAFQILYRLLDDKENRVEPVSKELLESARKGEVVIDIVSYGSRSEVTVNVLFKVAKNLPAELKTNKYDVGKWKKWLETNRNVDMKTK